MAHKTLIAGLTLTGLMMFGTCAHAQLQVIDAIANARAETQIIKAVEQLETAQSQLDTLNNVKSQIDEQLAAFGEMGTLNVPSLNFVKIASQLSSDINCLVPDYEQLMPQIKTDEIDIGSICSRGSAYKKGLLASPKELKEKKPREQLEVLSEIRTNRLRVITDATTKGLAQADMAIEASADTVKAAQEYKAAGAAAQTVNDRLQVLIEIAAADLQSQARIEQINAQILKVISAMSVRMALPAQSELADEQDQ